MNFVVLGDVCIDKNSIEGKFYKKAGGPPVFISQFLEKQGQSVTVISSYGKDFEPYKESLSLYPKGPNLERTLAYENIVINEERTQKCHYYKQDLLVKADNKMSSILATANCVFVAPLTPFLSYEYLKEVVDKINKKTLLILLPQGYFRNFDNNDNVTIRKFKEADKIIPLFDFMILSSEDFPDIEKLSKNWTQKFKTKIIITKAQLGADLISNGRIENFSTQKVEKEKIKDSTGAGDIFTAAFGYHFLKNKVLNKSIQFANIMARKRVVSSSISD